MASFEPFKDDATVLTLDGLTVENRLERIEIYGSLQVTRDKPGLELARELKRVLDATVRALEGETLPERITTRPSEKVRNPFDE
ncbi:hypothetical protein [Janthinobacterium sp. 17J80-10]|uniref:hypothetical protein n=1 Tax=Janthinobacterium sp. 17J80-10 TaxID=2497863 RepID=UPI00100597B8|nr:hypothetical protein [Janthinobacterium sp. 17J80-10]QAU34103.1 hypothetical protein EKL02_07825 [Janthinobacterium sp. 17J80-10]